MNENVFSLVAYNYKEEQASWHSSINQQDMSRIVNSYASWNFLSAFLNLRKIFHLYISFVWNIRLIKYAVIFWWAALELFMYLLYTWICISYILYYIVVPKKAKLNCNGSIFVKHISLSLYCIKSLSLYTCIARY